jgi:hypothetical protein
MPTEAQINANRLNAQKSTGPRSPEGKAVSSLNALKSGIDAHSQIIPGEDPAELEALTASFRQHFHPADPNQLSLVDALVAAEWTQRRLRRIEAQLWNYQIECLNKNLTRAEFLDASIQHNSPLGHAYQDALDPFSRVQRHIDATNRLYLRTLKTLQDLQAAQPLTPEIGFVPQTANPATGDEVQTAEISLPVPESAATPLSPPLGMPSGAPAATPRMPLPHQSAIL